MSPGLRPDDVFKLFNQSSIPLPAEVNLPPNQLPNDVGAPLDDVLAADSNAPRPAICCSGDAAYAPGIGPLYVEFTDVGI